MNTIISPLQAIFTLIAFGLAMIAIAMLSNKKRGEASTNRFLVADRNVGWLRGALSIAVSWIWAPAIFIASLQAYTKGIAGAFWFIVPNILCFFIFAPVALRLRKIMPEGFTLPEYIHQRFAGHPGAHGAFLIIFFGYQIGALIINALAGGTLLSLLTGIDTNVAILAMAGVALIYSLISGMEASIVTDVIQMLMILVIGFLLIPWTLIEAGGLTAITGGFGGVSGEFGNVFHPGIAFAFGIPVTISLLSGPIGDQMFFQRTFAVRKEHIVRTFVAGGLLFGIVPILLTTLGFIGANPAFGIDVSDPQMVAPLTLAHFLPRGAIILFVLMALGGLASTIDSAYVALSSLGAIDLYKRYINAQPTDGQVIRFSRVTMLIMSVIGTGIALLQPKLLWVFLIYGALASAAFFPTILSIFWQKVTANGTALAVILSLLFGLPLSVYANVTENDTLIVLSAIISLLIGGIVAVLDGWLNSLHTKETAVVTAESSLSTSVQ